MNEQIVIPAIMPKTFEELCSQMQRFEGVVGMVQIDVMDGKFVQTKSWPYKQIQDKDFLKIIDQTEGFPSWEELDFEIDLMTLNPQTESDRWIAAGAARIVVHYESAAPTEITMTLASIKEKGIETGLAFGRETPFETIRDFYSSNQSRIDFIQFMGIKQIGHQGEPFDNGVLDTLVEFKKSFPETIITVDGGVNFDTIESISNVGVGRVIVGSALNTGDSIKNTIEQFDAFLKFL